MRAPLLALALLAAAAPAAGAGISVRADAGLGGVARAGRWMPVTVVVENDGGPADATLTITVGGARVSRAIAMPSPARKRFEFFLRAPDVESGFAGIDIVSAGGAALGSTRAAFRIASGDEPFTLCVTAAGVTPDQARCTATLDTSAFPSSWRGLDAVDTVAWPAADTMAGLDEEQRAAYERAAAVRRWNASTTMAPRWPELPVEDGTNGPGSPLGFYAAVWLLGAALLARVARRPLLSYAAAALLVAGGTVAVVSGGRVGAAPLAVRQTSVVRAGGLVDGAQVLVHARVIFPSAGHVELRTPLGDADMTLTRGGELAATFDATGAAAIGGRAARRQETDLEISGFLSTVPVSVRHEDGSLEIVNRLPTALTDCALPDGFRMSQRRIDPGATVRIDPLAGVEDAAMVCTIERPEPHVAWSGGAVAHQGRSVLLLDLRPPEGAR